jgi:hypothetical protein
MACATVDLARTGSTLDYSPMPQHPSRKERLETDEIVDVQSAACVAIGRGVAKREERLEADEVVDIQRARRIAIGIARRGGAAGVADQAIGGDATATRSGEVATDVEIVAKGAQPKDGREIAAEPAAHAAVVNVPVLFTSLAR